MNTHVPKLMFICLLLCAFYLPLKATVALLENQEDVRVFVTAPSSPGANDGVIDLFIDEGNAPYFITYSKDDGSGSFSLEYEITAQNNGDEDYLNASEGIYRISITDAHCASLSLDIIVSLDCTCNLPILSLT